MISDNLYFEMHDVNISLFHLCLEVAQWLLIAALFFMLLRFRSHAKPLEKPTKSESSTYESVNSISFLGGFRVVNKDGVDITSRFTPVLRKLIAALVIHSINDKQGILSEKIDSLIWGYKPEGTASNNRNVYLSRLRKALEDVDGVTISTRNLLTTISFAPHVSCDYVEIMRLYKTDSAIVDVNRLLWLLSKGNPFVNMSARWQDAFREEFSVLTASYLSQLLSREDLSSTAREKILALIRNYDKPSI